MKPAERHTWIESYLVRRSISIAYTVDVCHSDFVVDYVEATDAACVVQFFGAPKCKQLGRDLAAMFEAGKLERSATGLWNCAGMGFPRWVYVYKLKDWHRPK